MKSWCPDWRLLHPWETLCVRKDYRHQALYCADTNRPMSAKISTEENPSSTASICPRGTINGTIVPYQTRKILISHGIRIDAISDVDTRYDTLSETLKLSNTSTLRSLYKLNNECISQAYRRTRAADIHSSSLFDVAGPKGTYLQWLTGKLNILERVFRERLSRTTHRQSASYSVFGLIDDITEQTTVAWLRKKFVLNGEMEDRWATKVNGLDKSIGNRKIVVTGSGYLVLAPDTTKVGDCVVVLYGACTPYVLRLAEGDASAEDSIGARDRRWHLIGECYVHGFMDGEAVNSERSEEEEDFVLI